ncbi:MAG: protein kinase domain-containing protein [Clostridium chrysemydis]|uniref:protein kinase domain-containing protein n=1 Tax=Clostridium chrysemydis TaxID=2665504 RepID=UPI003F39F6AA
MEINSLLDGKYKIIALAGKGGTSTVYKGININLGTEWAIKEISKSNKDKFDLLIEPNILKNLQHVSLPRIVDIIETKDYYYIVEDFIDGTSLENLLNQVDKFPEERVIKWAKELCKVLEYLHSQTPNPIIYRDMKPGNIMLSKKGDIKLVDFGIAREFKKEVTTDTVIIGTKGYAAPEQYGSHQTDERTDIYSLGVTLYHLLTGKGPNDPPFEILPVREINKSFSEGIEHIILKATKQNPNQRYMSIKEMCYDLDNIDKLSNQYKSNQRKIKIRVGVLGVAFVFSASLVVMGVLSIRNYKIKEYLEKVEIAVDTEKNVGMEKAKPVFLETTEMFPRRDEAYLALAKTYINNLQYDDALSLLQIESLNKNKDIRKNEEYKYLLGVCLFAKSDYIGALEEFSEIDGSKFPEYEFYKGISETLSKPEGLNKNDEVTNMMENLKQDLERSDDEEFKTRGYLMLADIYRDNSMVFENSEDMQINILEKAISQSTNKNNTILYERLAQAYYLKALPLLGDDSANKYLNKALDNYDILLKTGYETSSVYRNIGVIYKHLGKVNKAKETFNILIEKYPKDFKGYVELAFLNISTRNYKEAIKNYNLAKKFNTLENNNEISRLEILIEDIKGKG